MKLFCLKYSFCCQFCAPLDSAAWRGETTCSFPLCYAPDYVLQFSCRYVTYVQSEEDTRDRNIIEKMLKMPSKREKS
jgi:hypothetical protein